MKYVKLLTWVESANRLPNYAEFLAVCSGDAVALVTTENGHPMPGREYGDAFLCDISWDNDAECPRFLAGGSVVEDVTRWMLIPTPC